jgi:hypothetical protein
MRQLRTPFLLTLVLSLSLGSVLYGQGTAHSSKGSLTVEVTDSSGAIVQNADFTLLGAAGERKTKTDGRGVGVFYNLAPGVYGARVTFQGFRTAEVRNTVVKASKRTPVKVSMEPGAVTETVQVSENATSADTSSASTNSTLSNDVIQRIPVARNVAGLFALAPGAAPGGGTDTTNTPNQAYNPSISGSSGLENQYIIDGVNATDQGFDAFGVWSTQYGSLGAA